MPTPELSTLQTELAYYQLKVDECRECIKQLSNFNPGSDLSLTLAIKKLSVVELHFASEVDHNMAMAFFMTWHTHYLKRVRETSNAITALSAIPVNA